MKNITSNPVKHVVQILSISLCALTISSCQTSESADEFESQHGFKRGDYFGVNVRDDTNRGYVPREVREVAE